MRDFGDRSHNCPEDMCAFSEAVNFAQDVSIGQLRYNRYAGAWLNEAKVDYSRFRRQPSPDTPGLPARVYSYRDASSGNMTNNFIGSNLSIQDFTQKRLGFRDDLTYSHGGQHVFKMGASVDLVSYDVFKGNDDTVLRRDDFNSRTQILPRVPDIFHRRKVQGSRHYLVSLARSEIET